jgi:hypothetical protein
MAYMVMQQVTSAVRSAYAGSPQLETHRSAAAEARAWIESLALDPGLRNALREPIAALEEAFAALIRETAMNRGNGGDPR